MQKNSLIVYDLIASRTENKEEVSLDELKIIMTNFRIRHCDFNAIINALIEIGYLERINKQTFKKVI